MTDIDEELAALYGAARAQEAPSRADRLAVQAAVASALATAAVATSAQAAGGLATSQAVKALTAGKIALWLCAGAALGGVSTSVAWVVTSRPAVTAASSGAARAPVDSRGMASAQRPLVAPAPPAISSGMAAVSDLPNPLSSVVPRSTASAGKERVPAHVAPSIPPPSLLVESEGVQRVQQALAGGDASRALELLARQESDFRDGALREERAALRVLALCAAGRLDAARAAGQGFLAAYPHSPHAARVRASCSK